ncbi:MAG: signal peptidase I [Nocardioidaceae bacterium]
MLVVVIALVVAALLRAFVVQAYVVPTGSMENTIGTNQRILVQKFGSVHRGEVVVFTDPGGWITAAEKSPGRGPLGQALEFIGILPSTANNHLVKRVIGLPGDHVRCCDQHGRVTVNNHALAEASYVFPGNAPSAERFDVVVPKGTMWVMGDHRADSGDSRCHLVDGTAFVPLSSVTGRALAVVWPLDVAHWLSIPSTFDAVPDPGPPPDKSVVRRVSRC